VQRSLRGAAQFRELHFASVVFWDAAAAVLGVVDGAQH
jgi:hypothetical protein